LLTYSIFVGNYMSIALAFAIYAPVCHESNEPLLFPGNETFYTDWGSHSYSELIAGTSPPSVKSPGGGEHTLTLIYVEFEIWATFAPQTSNQLLNIVNDDPATWATYLPRLATYFNARIPPEQLTRPARLPSSTLLPLSLLIETHADTGGLIGRIPRVALENRVDIFKWSQRQEVKDA